MPYGQRKVFKKAAGDDDYQCSEAMSPPGVSQAIEVDNTPTAFSLCDEGHQGLQYDKETGLIYNRARYRHPEVGQFAQRDPKDNDKPGGGYHDGSNLYEYVGSNPVGYVDWNGLASAKTQPVYKFGSMKNKSKSQYLREHLLDDWDKMSKKREDRTFTKDDMDKFEKKEKAVMAKAKSLPDNCHALTCRKSGVFAAEAAPETQKCVKDPLNNVPFVEKQLLTIRDSLKKQQCKYQGKRSCDKKVGCVRLWLINLRTAHSQIAGMADVADMMESTRNQKKYDTIKKVDDLHKEWTKKAEDDYAKSLPKDYGPKGRFTLCYMSNHSARICGDKKVHHIPGIHEDLVIVKSFKDAIRSEVKVPYREDAVEYWQCPNSNKKK
jgi:RHS repeat-associated protein